MERGDCIGGYTKAKWTSEKSSKFVGDSNAILFNLSRNSHFPSKKTGKDIACDIQYGPCFVGGFGYNELGAY
jgi:hypothetical protein